jgi:hypothetical protein
VRRVKGKRGRKEKKRKEERGEQRLRERRCRVYMKRSVNPVFIPELYATRATSNINCELAHVTMMLANAER